MDNISRQAAINIAKDLLIKMAEYHQYNQAINNYCAELMKLPSAQPEPPKGHWVKVSGFATPGGDPVWECSECGKGRHIYGVEHRSYGADVSDGQWVSCPNCGADMRGEQEWNSDE